MHRLLSIFLLSIAVAFSSTSRTIKVLAIGNSFSEDAVEQYLYELCKAMGDSLVIGNAYIGGCEIDRHLDNLTSGKNDYAYRKIIGGKKTSKEKTALPEIITDEPWDIISLQQASHYSGQKHKYANLPALKKGVMDMMPNKDAEIVWHKTWSYAKSSNHDGFKNYGRSQKAMNDSIDAAVKEKVLPAGITRIIPSGDAVKIARNLIGESLTRDGFHLSYEEGRYIAACVWAEFLTGKSVVGNPWHPADLTPQMALAAQLAAHAAFSQP